MEIEKLGAEYYECEKCQEEFKNKTGICPMCGWGSEWMPGNEPEENGWYQVSLKSGHVSIFQFERFWMNKITVNDEVNEIIAYKSIKLSAPYAQPERELRCPFCCSLDYNKGEDESEIDYYCKICKSIIRDKTRKELYEIYDKLNPGVTNE